MIYYTPAFKEEYLQTSETEISKYIAMTNEAIGDSSLKGITLSLHCSEMIDIMDNVGDNGIERLEAFRDAKGNYTNGELLHSADMAMLLTRNPAQVRVEL